MILAEATSGSASRVSRPGYCTARTSGPDAWNAAPQAKKIDAPAPACGRQIRRGPRPIGWPGCREPGGGRLPPRHHIGHHPPPRRLFGRMSVFTSLIGRGSNTQLSQVRSQYRRSSWADACAACNIARGGMAQLDPLPLRVLHDAEFQVGVIELLEDLSGGLGHLALHGQQLLLFFAQRVRLVAEHPLEQKPVRSQTAARRKARILAAGMANISGRIKLAACPPRLAAARNRPCIRWYWSSAVSSAAFKYAYARSRSAARSKSRSNFKHSATPRGLRPGGRGSRRSGRSASPTRKTPPPKPRRWRKAQKGSRCRRTARCCEAGVA